MTLDCLLCILAKYFFAVGVVMAIIILAAIYISDDRR